MSVKFIIWGPHMSILFNPYFRLARGSEPANRHAYMVDNKATLLAQVKNIVWCSWCWFWSPCLWLHRRPWGGHPAWVEEVGLETPQVCSWRKGGAETSVFRGEASICARFLEGEQAGGGGEAECVWVTVGYRRGGSERGGVRGKRTGQTKKVNIGSDCFNLFGHLFSSPPPSPTCMVAVFWMYISTMRPWSTPLSFLVSFHTSLPLHILSQSIVLNLP